MPGHRGLAEERVAGWRGAALARVRVKICGVMTPEIGSVAVEAGADAVGLVFAESRRRITPARASRIVAALPPFVSAVGVFVDPTEDDLAAVAHGVPLDVVQLHGDEPPELCAWARAQGLRVIKAIKVDGPLNGARLEPYAGVVSAFLLEGKAGGLAGGSGQPFHWPDAAGVSGRFRIIASGGLRAETVAGALETLRPYAVDVSSGVESEGVKDPDKIRAFIEAVRLWEQSRPEGPEG